ncbi:diacylglycerol kinase family protein [Phenylobacterium sp.]|uniref:diacylglycerol/lipid kinase family protein n=1 Tax=Phenylobacterium sp. TaxID=1871053 RepID=UPI00301BF4C9
MRALLVHNARSGTRPVPREALEAALESAGFDVAYCSHRDEDLGAALARGFDLVVAAGGDGTVADVVSGLEDVEIPVGILPLGGSNNIAHALGVDADWRGLPARWSLDAWTRLDRGEAVGPWGRRPFVEAVGSGVLTEAAENAEEEPRTAVEKQANGRAAFCAALRRAEPFPCAIEAEGWSWAGPCLMVEVMNIPVVGSRLGLAGNGSPGDGLLDVVIVTPDDRDALLSWAEQPDNAHPPLGARTTRAARLTIHDRPFRLDDRSPDDSLAGEVEIRLRSSWVKVLKPGRRP